METVKIKIMLGCAEVIADTGVSVSDWCNMSYEQRESLELESLAWNVETEVLMPEVEDFGNEFEMRKYEKAHN